MIKFTKKRISKREAVRLAIQTQAEELCIPAFMTPLWREQHCPKTVDNKAVTMRAMANTFARRQRVRLLRFVGPSLAPDWSEVATIIGKHPDLLDGNWYVIRFDDGGMISSHAERLMADNAPAFKGRLPSYASTQR